MTNTARRDGTAHHDASMEAMSRHLYGDGDMDEERERIATAVATLDGADVRQVERRGACRAKPVRFRLRQGNMTVAAADSEGAILHYADQYRQDGEVTIQHNADGHWKRWALLCQWPLKPEDHTND